MMKTREVDAVESDEGALVAYDPTTSVVEQDEVLLLWNNRQASLIIRLVLVRQII